MWSRRQMLQLLAAPASGGLGACRDSAPPVPPFTRALLDLAAEAGFGGADERRRSEAELARIARQVRQGAIGRAPAPEDLRRTLFADLGFNRVVDNLAPPHALLPPVLADRRGSCVGLGCLYLALAESLAIAAWGVLVPGHFFVRVADPGRPGGVHNVELLRAGEVMTDGWYREKYGVPTPQAEAYLRPLVPAEVLAVVRFNLGNHQREAGALDRAAASYAQAARDFPSFPEAHASLGLTHHLRGRLAEARQAYQAAHKLHPTLPGLDQNLAKLEASETRTP